MHDDKWRLHRVLTGRVWIWVHFIFGLLGSSRVFVMSSPFTCFVLVSYSSVLRLIRRFHYWKKCYVRLIIGLVRLRLTKHLDGNSLGVYIFIHSMRDFRIRVWFPLCNDTSKRLAVASVLNHAYPDCCGLKSTITLDKSSQSTFLNSCPKLVYMPSDRVTSDSELWTRHLCWAAQSLSMNHVHRYSNVIVWYVKRLIDTLKWGTFSNVWIFVLTIKFQKWSTRGPKYQINDRVLNFRLVWLSEYIHSSDRLLCSYSNKLQIKETVTTFHADHMYLFDWGKRMLVDPDWCRTSGKGNIQISHTKRNPDYTRKC